MSQGTQAGTGPGPGPTARLSPEAHPPEVGEEPQAAEERIARILRREYASMESDRLRQAAEAAKEATRLDKLNDFRNSLATTKKCPIVAIGHPKYLKTLGQLYMSLGDNLEGLENIIVPFVAQTVHLELPSEALPLTFDEAAQIIAQIVSAEEHEDDIKEHAKPLFAWAKQSQKKEPKEVKPGKFEGIEKAFRDASMALNATAARLIGAHDAPREDDKNLRMKRTPALVEVFHYENEITANWKSFNDNTAEGKAFILQELRQHKKHTANFHSAMLLAKDLIAARGDAISFERFKVLVSAGAGDKVTKGSAEDKDGQKEMLKKLNLLAVLSHSSWDERERLSLKVNTNEVIAPSGLNVFYAFDSLSSVVVIPQLCSRAPLLVTCTVSTQADEFEQYGGGPTTRSMAARTAALDTAHSPTVPEAPEQRVPAPLPVPAPAAQEQPPVAPASTPASSSPAATPQCAAAVLGTSLAYSITALPSCPTTHFEPPKSTVTVLGEPIQAQVIHTLLKARTLVPSAVVESFLRLLAQAKPSIAVVGSSALFHLDQHGSLPRALTRKLDSNPELVVAPIFKGPDHAGHWALFVWRPQDSFAKVLNSLSACEVDAKRIMKALEKWGTADLIVRRPSVPQQDNAFDCGVFTMMIALLTAFGCEWSHKASEVAAYRTYVARCLVDGKLYKPPIERLIPWRPAQRRPAAHIEHFHCHMGEGAPHVGTAKAPQIISWALRKAPANIAEAVRSQYRSKQLRALERLQELAAQADPSTAVVDLAINLIETISHPSSALTMAHTLMGALKRLDQYAEQAPVSLNHDSKWKDFLRLLDKRKMATNPTIKPHLLVEDFRKVLESCPDRLRPICLLIWGSAARIDNALDLHPEEIFLGHDLLQIVWKRAKTCAKAGEYTTSTYISKLHANELKRFLSRLPRDQPLYELGTNAAKEVTKVLRELVRAATTPKHDLRAFRRGALTALAKNGTPLEDIMKLSGHKSLETLRGYLGQGLYDEATAAISKAATKALW